MANMAVAVAVAVEGRGSDKSSANVRAERRGLGGYGDKEKKVVWESRVRTGKVACLS